MKTMLRLLPLAAAILLLNACGQPAAPGTDSTSKKSNIAQLGWLSGTWGSSDSASVSTETWQKKNDSTFAGHSYTIAGSDTVFNEWISLEERAGNLNYVVTVKNQNGELPVAFAMTSIDEKTVVFENPMHDFPQRIAYTRVNADSLYAEISATQEGKTIAVPYPMKRRK